jgi:hypothetical protein
MEGPLRPSRGLHRLLRWGSVLSPMPIMIGIAFNWFLISIVCRSCRHPRRDTLQASPSAGVEDGERPRLDAPNRAKGAARQALVRRRRRSLLLPTAKLWFSTQRRLARALAR